MYLRDPSGLRDARVGAAEVELWPDLEPRNGIGKRLDGRRHVVTAKFTLRNNGAKSFEGCFGPSWGVSVIEGGHDAGLLVRVEHPSCDERFTLLPGQEIVWSKKVPLNKLRAGTAKVTGWVKVVDPAACDPSSGCHEVSVASPMMTVAVGAEVAGGAA